MPQTRRKTLVRETHRHLFPRRFSISSFATDRSRSRPRAIGTGRLNRDWSANTSGGSPDSTPTCSRCMRGMIVRESPRRSA